MATTSTLTTAVRDATRFDRSAVSPIGGLLAAVPVVGLLGALIGAGQPVAAVTTAVGAMLVGIAWRVNGGRPPLVVMAIDATAMGVATFAGAITGEILWVHLIVLALFSLLGGMLVGLGRRAGIVGFQAILAVVVFGRFTEPLGPALGIAGLVCAGGMTQVAFLAIVRWPTPLAVQRRATAAAYRALAELALGSAQTSGLPAAGALDDAEASLSGGSLLGAPAVAPLRSLVNEGHRIRVAITALNGLTGRLPGDGPPARAVHEIATDTGATLRTAADAIGRSGLAGEEVGPLAARVSAAIAELARDPAPPDAPDALWGVLMRRLAALAGQLRAVASLAPAGASASPLRSRRPHPRTDHPIARLRAGLTDLRDGLSLNSPAARHAIRLAIIVPGAELLARALPVERGYWVVVAAAAVLRPEFGATFTRGTERAGGTALGVAIAGLTAAWLHPSQPVTIALVGLMAWAGYTTFAASYALGFAFITALVVFLLNTITPDTVQTATARLIDTLIGGALGLLFFAAWPTWARRSAHQSLANLARALCDYQAFVLRAFVSGEPLGEPARGLARAARLTRSQAEADVARSLAEPETRRIDPRKGPGLLGEMQRLVYAIHDLRLDAQDEREREPMARLAALTRGLDAQLSAAARALVTDDLQLSSEHIDLRAALDRFARSASSPEQALIPGLDELVDATNSIADLLARTPEPAPVAQSTARPISA
jgi:uncharacterized membrane protein YccC